MRSTYSIATLRLSVSSNASSTWRTNTVLTPCDAVLGTPCDVVGGTPCDVVGGTPCVVGGGTPCDVVGGTPCDVVAAGAAAATVDAAAGSIIHGNDGGGAVRVAVGVVFSEPP